jgi:hypothetical protein
VQFCNSFTSPTCLFSLIIFVEPINWYSLNFSWQSCYWMVPLCFPLYHHQ